jgi:hypothetical protein
VRLALRHPSDLSGRLLEPSASVLPLGGDDARREARGLRYAAARLAMILFPRAPYLSRQLCPGSPGCSIRWGLQSQVV